MIAFRFDNTYTRLPRLFYSKQGAVAAPAPKLVILNHALAADLGLDFSGMDDAALAAARATLRARGAEVGFQFGDRSRIWNTFDAHRLLCWAGTVDFGKQRALKHALLRAYHLDGSNPSDPALLIDLATQVGLNTETARVILSSNQYADEVRKAEAFYQRSGIQAVPSVIINDRHLLQGGQPAAVFEQAIRQLAKAEN